MVENTSAQSRSISGVPTTPCTNASGSLKRPWAARATAGTTLAKGSSGSPLKLSATPAETC